ncbi:MAG TPA: sigma-E factor negative regulatory protein [Usitatibacter sp.]|nr:sigma-E factor negative regulatory protein [Usitatibacter sp.]
MTQEISSLMDGECEAHEAERAIRSCCASREAAEKWETYHLIGDVLRGGKPHPTHTAERVRRALAQEPAILARPKRVHDTTFGRVALAAAASVATIGVVGWIGTQGGHVGGAGPVVTKAPSAIQPVANKAAVPAPSALSVDVQDYYVAHKQLPSADLYKPVNRAVPAPAAR